MTFSIYLITNTVNDKVYVGVTCKTLAYRFSQHIRAARRQDVPTALCRAIFLHGSQAFNIELLDECDNEDNAYAAEKQWIAYYDSRNRGYNMTEGGEVGWRGAKSEVHKRKIGNAQLGRTRADLAANNRARTLWLSCRRCKTQMSKTEFWLQHNTAAHQAGA